MGGESVATKQYSCNQLLYIKVAYYLHENIKDYKISLINKQYYFFILLQIIFNIIFNTYIITFIISYINYFV